MCVLMCAHLEIQLAEVIAGGDNFFVPSDKRFLELGDFLFETNACEHVIHLDDLNGVFLFECIFSIFAFPFFATWFADFGVPFDGKLEGMNTAYNEVNECPDGITLGEDSENLVVGHMCERPLLVLDG